MCYLKKVSIAFDQLINALCNGWPDETLSSRAWRWYVGGIRSWPMRIINLVFCWEKNHCQASYESERRYRHLPPELRV